MNNEYDLTLENRQTALEHKLVDADWYLSPVSREHMANVLERKDWPAIRDTLLWFTLLSTSAYLGFILWGSAWAIIPFAIYGVLFTSASDSRWHESLHGTAFKTDILNNILYEVAAFMVCRESTPWRWSHMRHHSDTYITGVDPEITFSRPIKLLKLLAIFTNILHVPNEYKNIVLHSCGRLAKGEAMYVPESQYKRMFFIARVYLLIYVLVVVIALVTGSLLPLMYLVLPSFYGQWLLPVYGLPQHIVMAENTLDHRLNTRTVYMNPVLRFLYWEMNYHIEHHMYPMVPYHQLHRLHHYIKDDLPPSYRGLVEVYREIIPAIRKQLKVPGYFVDRREELPKSTAFIEPMNVIATDCTPDIEGWLAVCEVSDIEDNEVTRLDFGEQTYAIYKTVEGKLYATAGLCTHADVHLAGGLLQGNLIECPKHNGRFDIRDGSPKRAPVCRAIKTYSLKIIDNTIFININEKPCDNLQENYSFRVISNKNVATFIKELVIEPLDYNTELSFKPGDYMQFIIPEFDTRFSEFDIQDPYLPQWKKANLMMLNVVNKQSLTRNYSIANRPEETRQLTFTIRIQLPPPGFECMAGRGSSYMFQLKPGCEIKASEPQGDFHPKASEAEMVYVGGGAGMAPLRSHLSHLFEGMNTTRKISFWYGARSRNELFYDDYFEGLASQFSNFSFNVALSEPLDTDNWSSYTGFIHEVLLKEYLQNHLNINYIEFYLCGPPAMLAATRAMLNQLGVADDHILYDEFL